MGIRGLLVAATIVCSACFQEAPAYTRFGATGCTSEPPTAPNGTVCGLDLDLANDYIYMTGDGANQRIFITKSDGTTIGAQLRMDDTTPAFYSLTYNTLFNGVSTSIGSVRVWFIKGFSGAGGEVYNKINQVRAR